MYTCMCVSVAWFLNGAERETERQRETDTEKQTQRNREMPPPTHTHTHTHTHVDDTQLTLGILKLHVLWVNLQILFQLKL